MKPMILLVMLVALTVSMGWIRAENMEGMGSKDPSMKDMPMDTKPSKSTHHAFGSVKKVDQAKGTVTISHGPVKTLNWPAMTMTFGVKDKSLLNQLTQGKKVEVEFVQEGPDYIIVKVK